DRMGPSNDPIRFPYLYDIETTYARNDDGNIIYDDGVPRPAGGYQFGDTQIPAGSEPWLSGMRYSNVASPYVSWEVATKKNLGFDFSFLSDQISGVLDLFHERRDGIYMPRNFLANMVGLESNPAANVGIVQSKGFDGNIDLKQKFNTVDLTLRGNI